MATNFLVDDSAFAITSKLCTLDYKVKPFSRLYSILAFFSDLPGQQVEVFVVAIDQSGSIVYAKVSYTIINLLSFLETTQLFVTCSNERPAWYTLFVHP